MNNDSGYKRVRNIEEGHDYILGPYDELPYKLLRNLGHGAHAHVEEVQDQNTGAVYARKVFQLKGSRNEIKRIFENEVKIIRRLAPHHHITSLFATYVARREVGLVLTPVATHGSLDLFLDDANDGFLTPAEMTILRNSFGCLASGLEFMHIQRIRHKDIKPSNILVHNSSLIYTDFGISFDYSSATRSTTTGPSSLATRKYAAPELYEGLPRNSKTDIFSLGCVYLEILCAITFYQMRRDISPYQDHLEEIQLILDTSPRIDDWIAIVIGSTRQMLQFNPEVRPSAKSIKDRLASADPKAFCQQCHDDNFPEPEPKDGNISPLLTPSLPPTRRQSIPDILPPPPEVQPTVLVPSFSPSNFPLPAVRPDGMNLYRRHGSCDTRNLFIS